MKKKIDKIIEKIGVTNITTLKNEEINMPVEMLSIFILTLLLKNQGIFFILLLYSHMFKNKIVINSRSLFERL
jgi:hypothetical protein